MNILRKLRKLCSCKRERKIDYEAYFLPTCENGNIEQVSIITKNVSLNPDTILKGIDIAIENGNHDIVKFLFNLVPFSQQRTEMLNSGLKRACLKNNYMLAETMVQLGASIVIGLRNSNSPNITKMLYRYEQNSEIINY